MTTPSGATLPFDKRGNCKNCGTVTHWILYRYIRQDESHAYYWACSKCNRQNPDQSRQIWIPNELVESRLDADTLEALPMRRYSMCQRCAVCGKRGAQLHHWSPRAIFGRDEAEQWPQDWLCKEHHDEWHIKVTPQLKGEVAA